MNRDDDADDADPRSRIRKKDALSSWWRWWDDNNSTSEKDGKAATSSVATTSSSSITSSFQHGTILAASINGANNGLSLSLSLFFCRGIEQASTRERS
jgi:hypothetical protein